MKTLNQSASVRGEAISNNDPEMVITLDPHPGVQISSIQDDSITYEFLGDVTENTLYTLNLTFVYKNLYRAVIEIRLAQNTIAPTSELNAEWITTNPEIVGASSNHIVLKLTDENGDPATGVTLKSINVDSIPNNPGVCAGYSNIIVETDPGTYWININVSNLVGAMDVDLVLIHNETEFALPTKTYQTPGTPVKARIDKDQFYTTEPRTDVNLFLTQDKYARPDAPLDVDVFEFSVTGGGTTTTVPVFELNESSPIDITPTGVLEDILIKGKIRNTPMDFGGFIRDFELTIPVFVEMGPAIENPVERMSLQLWNPMVIGYDIMYGSENITTSVTSVVIDNLSEIQEWVEIIKGEDNRWYLKAIKADETNETIINPQVTINLTYNGKDYSLPLTFEARILPRDGQTVNRFDVQFV